jgi:hypothetical protein
MTDSLWRKRQKPEQRSVSEHLEPVAWMSEDEHEVYTSKQVDGYFQHDHIPLYTTPQQRTWVGLTDKDKNQIAERLGLADVAWLDLMQAIEAKLKEKNG